MINFRNVKYIVSLPEYSLRPKDRLKEIVFIGKSNVGKSTIINSLCGQRIAYSSKNAGKTKYLNYFLVDDSFYLVDSPGYGYTSYGSKEDESFGRMMEDYFKNPLLVGAVFLIDSRREPSEEDLGLLDFLKEDKIKTLLVYSKSDQANQSEKAKALRRKLANQEILFSKNDNPTKLRLLIADFLK